MSQKRRRSFKRLGQFVSLDLITIKINNWEKHNPRKDVKRPSWFALSNRLIEDADFYTFTGNEFKTWIYILSQASQKQKSEFNIYPDHADRACCIPKKDLISALEKLQKIQAITVDVTHTLRERDDNVPLHNNTIQNRTGQDSTLQNNITTSAKASAPSLGSQLFETYSKAFFKRYGVNPVRNAKTNSLCKQLATRLGEDAHQVIEFYLIHNDQWFLKMQHDLGSLVSKAESMHSQWQRGQAVTSVQVRQFEKQSGNMDLLEKVKRGEI